MIKHNIVSPRICIKPFMSAYHLSSPCKPAILLTFRLKCYMNKYSIHLLYTLKRFLENDAHFRLGVKFRVYLNLPGFILGAFLICQLVNVCIRLQSYNLVSKITKQTFIVEVHILCARTVLPLMLFVLHSR